MSTRVDLDELNRGLGLSEPQLHGDAAALLSALREVFASFDGLSTGLLLETLEDLGYRLHAADPAEALELVLSGALALEQDRRGRWRRAVSLEDHSVEPDYTGSALCPACGTAVLFEVTP